MDVTPDMAREWLKKNKRNRKFRLDRGVGYATEIDSGRWLLTHQGVAFSETGELLDGQHRLWAIVRTGKTVKMAVFFDVPVQKSKDVGLTTMDAIDRGAPRSIANQLQIAHGTKNAARIASWMRSVALTLLPGSKALSVGQTLGLLEFYGKSASAIGDIENAREIVAPIAGPIVVVHSFAPQKAEEFAAAYASLDGGKKHPAMLLRRWVDSHRYEVRVAGQGARSAAVAALYHHCIGSGVSIIRRGDESRDWLLSNARRYLEQVYRLLRGVDAEQSPVDKAGAK